MQDDSIPSTRFHRPGQGSIRVGLLHRGLRLLTRGDAGRTACGEPRSAAAQPCRKNTAFPQATPATRTTRRWFRQRQTPKKRRCGSVACVVGASHLDSVRMVRHSENAVERIFLEIGPVKSRSSQARGHARDAMEFGRDRRFTGVTAGVNAKCLCANRVGTPTRMLQLRFHQVRTGSLPTKPSPSLIQKVCNTETAKATRTIPPVSTPGRCSR